MTCLRCRESAWVEPRRAQASSDEKRQEDDVQAKNHQYRRGRSAYIPTKGNGTSANCGRRSVMMAQANGKNADCRDRRHGHQCCGITESLPGQQSVLRRMGKSELLHDPRRYTSRIVDTVPAESARSDAACDPEMNGRSLCRISS